MTSGPYDISIEFKNSILTLINQARIVELEGDLLLRRLEVFTKKTFTEDEQKEADQYLNATIKTYYLNKNIEEQWKALAVDVEYWSDRWHIYRAHTFKYIWEHLSNDKLVAPKE